MTISICPTKCEAGSRFTLVSFGRLFNRCSTRTPVLRLSIASISQRAQREHASRPQTIQVRTASSLMERNPAGTIAAVFVLKDWRAKQLTLDAFKACGRACLEMPGGIFQLLGHHRAVLFAVAIPPARPPRGFLWEEFSSEGPGVSARVLLLFPGGEPRSRAFGCRRSQSGRSSVRAKTRVLFHENYNRPLS